jgi:hypothetical protein
MRVTLRGRVGRFRYGGWKAYPGATQRYCLLFLPTERENPRLSTTKRPGCGFDVLPQLFRRVYSCFRSVPLRL